MDTLRRFAWVFGVLGGALVLLFLGQRWAMGESDATWMAVGGVGAAMLAAYLLLDREDISQAAGTRAVRYGSGAVLTVLLALGVTVALNVVSKRYDKRWDWTSTGRHTLSEQSIKVVTGLADPVQVVGFFPTGSVEESTFRDLIEGYQVHTDLLELTLVDPVQEPLMAQQYAITSAFGTVVLASGEDRQRLEASFDEEAVTNALIRLVSGVEHIVCFTSGHGEREVDDDASVDGLGGVVIKMEGQNYTVRTFQPLREGRVPEDCEVVVVAGPQSEFLPPEREALARYVVGGGQLLVLLDPTYTDQPAADLARYGIAVGKDLVLENNPNYQLEGGDPSYVVLDAKSFDFHPIVSGSRAISLLRVARSVGAVEGFEGANVQVLARTSEMAWAETDLSGLAMPQPDGEDIIGNVPLIAVSEIVDPEAIQVGAAVLEKAGSPIPEAPAEAAPDAPEDGAPAATEPTDEADEPEIIPEPPAEAPAPPVVRKPGGKVVVFGDSDFISNGLIIQGENQNLFLNAVAWLVGEEDQIAIRPNEAGAGSLTVTALQSVMIALLSLIFVPGAAAGAAVATWARRRRL